MLQTNLRVLYMVPYLAAGGTERHLIDLIRTLSWVEPPVVIAPDGASRSMVEAMGGRWCEVPVLGLERQSMKSWREAFSRSVAELDPDVIHVHAGVELLWVTRHLAPARPRVFTVHGYAGSGMGLSYRLAAFLGGRLAQRVIAVSHSEEKRLSAVPSSRLRVILNGVAGDGLPEPGPRVPGVPEDAVVVAVASRLEPYKGIDLVVEAFIEVLRRAGPVVNADGAPADAHLVIMGIGSQAEELRRRIAETNVEHRVHLVGYLPQAAAYFQRADVVVQTSRQDALPLTVAEALAAGVPTIVSSAGGLPELVEDGVSGLVVPAGRVKPLTDALGHLLRDADLRRRMGRAARHRYEQRFTLERFAAETLEVYREVAASRKEVVLGY